STATPANGSSNKVCNGKSASPKGEAHCRPHAPREEHHAEREAYNVAGNGRDARGRFTPGNLGGPGNPFARRTAQLRKAFGETASEENVKDVAVALLFKAKSGDVAAAKLWLAYAVGKPAETANPDTLDCQEFKRWHDNSVTLKALDRMIEGMPAE